MGSIDVARSGPCCRSACTSKGSQHVYLWDRVRRIAMISTQAAVEDLTYVDPHSIRQAYKIQLYLCSRTIIISTFVHNSYPKNSAKNTLQKHERIKDEERWRVEGGPLARAGKSDHIPSQSGSRWLIRLLYNSFVYFARRALSLLGPENTTSSPRTVSTPAQAAAHRFTRALQSSTAAVAGPLSSMVRG